MIEDRSSDIQSLRDRVTEIGQYLHLDAKRAELLTLEERTTAPDFWDDQNTAQRVMAQAAGLRDEIALYESISAGIDDLEVANELAVSEADVDLAAEATASLKELARRTNELELSTWFTGEFDSGDALVTILPGQGGLEAQDWHRRVRRSPHLPRRDRVAASPQAPLARGVSRTYALRCRDPLRTCRAGALPALRPEGLRHHHDGHTA